MGYTSGGTGAHAPVVLLTWYMW